MNQIVVGEILRTMGVEFEIAADGQRAVEAARSGRFDAVLMDCQMPLMDGFEATRAIRSAEGAGAPLSGRGGRLPIVALTANAMAGDRERCLGAGMDWYTSKPINPDELRRALARVLVGGAGGGGPAAGASAAGDGAEPFSCRALLEWCRPGTSSAMTALDKFEEQLRADLVAIEGELERGDTAELARLGHRLRGSASLLRADDLSRVALTLEDAARERRLDAARVGLSELRAQVQRCLDYVPTARRLAAARSSEGGGVAPLDGAGGR